MVLLLACAMHVQTARAQGQDDGEESAAATPVADAEDVCPAACLDFAFLSSGATSRLGLAVSTTWIAAPGEDSADVGLLASYFAQAYRTRGSLSSRALLHGALGGGSAGTEGSASAALDFGVRAPISDMAGPMLRLGPSAHVMGHDRLQRFELVPLMLTAGFQRVDDGGHVEIALRSGLLAAGRVRAAGMATGLSGALELGGGLSAHVPPLQLETSLVTVTPGPIGRGARMGLLSLTGCVDLGSLVLCAEAQSLQVQLRERDGRPRSIRATYFVVTAALGP